MTLPAEFLEEMEKLLGDEFPEFLASYDMPRRNGLRLNRRRISPQEFEKCAPFPVERIPWTDNGYYTDWRDMPARHPYYNAGLYYLQEPSAMAPAQILPVDGGDRILDLCAAPGGKATELGARLCSAFSRGPDGSGTDTGLLVANEISASRARALLHNIEAFGIPNALVTNETPARLAERFPAWFDKILVDAPCSGEGMFRKDPDVVKAWYPEKVRECAAIQREIILQAADMLRPGGYMVYSTCTFAPEENEMILLHLLKNREQMELVQIPCSEGRESFRPAFSAEKLREYGCPGDPEDIDLTKAVRIWPHHAGGEGHFIALLKKRGEENAAELQGGCGSARESAVCGTGAGHGAERESRRERGACGGTETPREKKKKNASRRDSASGRSPETITAAEYGLVREFLQDFLPGFLQEDDTGAGRLEKHGGKLYLTPEETSGMRGFTFLRNGLYLGELKKDRFEPSQELAMALPCRPAGDTQDPVPENGAGEQGRWISFSPRDRETAQYLQGGTIRPKGGRQNGWYLVCVDGYPLGWGKLAGGILKNKLPAGWRDKSGSLT